MKRYFVKFSEFADDTKIAIRVNTLNDKRLMQRTFANMWDMDFNVHKCGVMHTEKRN